MYQEQFDMVTGNLNGAAWRRKCSEDQRRHSTIEEAFANTNLPIPQGPTALWGPGGVNGEWCVDLLSHQERKMNGTLVSV